MRLWLLIAALLDSRSSGRFLLFFVLGMALLLISLLRA
jgi:hypothetical protein